MATSSDSHSAGTQAHGGAPHSDVFPPFDTTHFSSQLLWLALTFGALYLLMSRVALPRIAGILENRQATISGDLDYSVTLQKLVDDQLAKGLTIEDKPAVKRAISSVPVVKPIKITAPNSVFALGNAFTK